MKKNIDWLDIFGRVIAVLTFITTFMTATVCMLNEIEQLREAHNHRLGNTEHQ